MLAFERILGLKNVPICEELEDSLDLIQISSKDAGHIAGPEGPTPPKAGKPLIDLVKYTSQVRMLTSNSF
ncbi:MAG TPA: hypothetical protein P5572_12305 [Phycisphaerae bacterium]|nr:hypothetical protein [Phycisphaerae bacterium]